MNLHHKRGRKAGIHRCMPSPSYQACLPLLVVAVALAIGASDLRAQQIGSVDPDRDYSTQQLTSGSRHHMFGYIGHAGTIPWNGSGRYILALRSSFHDHMPELNEPADIVLLDCQHDYRARKVDQTRAWNPQQGTMFYWNPRAPETQFFFNDRDPESGTLMTVLFDLSKGDGGERIREYRFPDSPVANSGVAQGGGHFLALNYGRLARLRLVTGYAGLEDWSRADNAPGNDGIFKVDVTSGERALVVSYRQLRELVREDFPHIDDYGLFINHTLWNRNDDRIYFYLRANFKSELPKVDVPMTVKPDGSELTRHRYYGGHPEWGRGNVMIGADGNRQIRYDTVARKIVGIVGKPGTFPNPGGDVAWSPDRQWFANGHKRKGQQRNFFTLLHEPSGRVIRTEGFPIGQWLSGTTRIDPAPRWNRESNQILFAGLDTETNTRQLFLLTIDP